MRRNQQNHHYGGGEARQHQHMDAGQIEDENETMTGVLRDKVGHLKSLSINIGDEVREQNKMLSEMSGVFDRSEGLLKATMSRVGEIAKLGSYKLYLYLLLFALFVFFICWVIIKTR